MTEDKDDDAPLRELVATYEQPDGCIDDAHRMRLMHMLLRAGDRIGRGFDWLAGYVFYAFDGKAYGIAQTRVRIGDYALTKAAIRRGLLPIRDDDAEDASGAEKPPPLTERQRFAVRAAIWYAKANVDELNEAYYEGNSVTIPADKSGGFLSGGSNPP